MPWDHASQAHLRQVFLVSDPQVPGSVGCSGVLGTATTNLLVTALLQKVVHAPPVCYKAAAWAGQFSLICPGARNARECVREHFLFSEGMTHGFIYCLGAEDYRQQLYRIPL